MRHYKWPEESLSSFFTWRGVAWNEPTRLIESTYIGFLLMCEVLSLVQWKEKDNNSLPNASTFTLMCVDSSFFTIWRFSSLRISTLCLKDLIRKYWASNEVTVSLSSKRFWHSATKGSFVSMWLKIWSQNIVTFGG